VGRVGSSLHSIMVTISCRRRVFRNVNFGAVCASKWSPELQASFLFILLH